MAEEPRIGPAHPGHEGGPRPALGIPETGLGIKAKTNEGLGPVGEMRAIACYAVALSSLPD